MHCVKSNKEQFYTFDRFCDGFKESSSFPTYNGNQWISKKDVVLDVLVFS